MERRKKVEAFVEMLVYAGQSFCSLSFCNHSRDASRAIYWTKRWQQQKKLNSNQIHVNDASTLLHFFLLLLMSKAPDALRFCITPWIMAIISTSNIKSSIQLLSLSFLPRENSSDTFYEHSNDDSSCGGGGQSINRV